MTTLRREIGLPGAILLGLGSMVGTGVFVSLGISAGAAGWGLVPAIVVAALLALANALSSAQLAAAHPVSGGTYEYGRRWLSPSMGFAAGWTFLCAKTASGATAALGAAGYAAALVRTEPVDPRILGVAALAIAALLTALVAGGIRRSNLANAIIVSITLAALLALVAAASMVPAASVPGDAADRSGASERVAASWPAFLQSTALMFVAFTGYGRLATLGEEVREPRRTIPRAILVTMAVVTALYLLVAWVSLRTLGPAELARVTAERAAPLEAVAEWSGGPWLRGLVAVGAITAMLGVLLNLILGLSRVVLAMARQGDAPTLFSRIGARHGSPTPAVLLCGTAIALLALVGGVKFSWSLSAFTVLLYYAITNAAALRLRPEDRRAPRAVAWAGLVACLSLAFWVEWRAWAAGVALLAIGFVLRAALRRARRAPAT